tara:strand:- start:115 stop:405 length:291 start_codon:yes stop_codon:yes gene_type:complete
MEIVKLIFDWLQPVFEWIGFIGGLILYLFVTITVVTLCSYFIQQVVEAFLPLFYPKKTEEEWENRTETISALCALAFWLYFMFFVFRQLWYFIVNA